MLEGANPEQAAAMAAEFLKAFRTGGPNGYGQKNLELTPNDEQAGTRAFDLGGCLRKSRR